MHDLFPELCWIGGALIVSALSGAFAKRVGQPKVLGAMVGGLVISMCFGLTHILEEIRAGNAHGIRSLAEIAAMLLLFSAGMESDFHSMRNDAKTGWKVAVIGVLFPIFGGFVYSLMFIHVSWPVALFQGGVFAATSVGITAAVLGELGVIKETYARIIISAAVIDDVLGLLVLALCQAIASSGEVGAGIIVEKIAMAGLFVVVLPIAGHFLARKVLSFLNAFDPDAREAIVLGWMFLYGAGAVYAGLAAIVGAYFAGVALEEEYFNAGEEHSLKEKPIERFISGIIRGLAPIFFVYAVCMVDPMIFLNVTVLAHGFMFTVIAMAGKLMCGLFAPKGEGWLVGCGMSPRGEVGIIFATIGLTSGILTQDLFGASMIMVLLSTVCTPPLLSSLIKSHGKQKILPQTA